MRKTGLLFLFVIASFKAANAGDNDFAAFINGYSSVKSIKGNIVQHIYSSGQSEKFSGDYSSVSGGLFRIDYMSPERQTVFCNSRGLFWYYPEREIVFVKYKSDSGSGFESSLPGNPLQAGFDRVNTVYEGIRFYGLLKYAHVYSFRNAGDSNIVQIWFEPGRRFVVRKYIKDSSGREIMKEVYHKYFRYENAFIPSEIELFARSSEGIIHTHTEYSDLVINTQLDKRLFEFEIKKNMTVRSFNE